ncbi:hypothetical protein [Streptomyces sp. NPDC046805]|uniref:hypothetical protein n=1 Tax=Streptomyces sp. NPDC046805 TaxID=3155134 RepID=UPI0033D19CBA
MVLGVVGSPASARQLDPGPPSGQDVLPEEVGNDTTCPVGTSSFLVKPVPDGESAHNVDTVGQIVVTLTSDTQTFDFSISGPLAARQVIVHSNVTANRYTYDAGTGFPSGVAFDTHLHAPIGNVGGFYDITSIDFCIIPSPYNGTGTGTA